MCDPITAVVAGSAILGAGMSAKSASKANKTAQASMAASERQAQQQAQRAESQFNKANQKMPGIAAMFNANRRSAGQGLGSTFLTGTKGVPTSVLPLGGGPSLLGN